jgi:hypothetical protein
LMLCLINGLMKNYLKKQMVVGSPFLKFNNE